jgi:glycosyltransferase involved in cell wall biosynthesis
LDVLASPSFGEGFGVPVIEAQACGTPVIVNDFSAQPELVGAGWTVEGQPFADMNQTAWFQIPSVDSIVDRLERCYSRTAPEIATDMKAARAKAIQYDVTRVWRNNWSGTLAAIEHRLPSVSPITE